MMGFSISECGFRNGGWGTERLTIAGLRIAIVNLDRVLNSHKIEELGD